MKDGLEEIFAELKGKLDLKEPAAGHKDRFLQRLNAQKGTIALPNKKHWWSPVTIAASVMVLCALAALTYLGKERPIDEQVAEIAPEASKTEFYFVNLIEAQIKELKKENIPATQKLVDDAMRQLHKLERDYGQLEKDLVLGGNSKLILSAMITNFKTRIDLLQHTINKIEELKNIENHGKETAI